MSMPIKKSVKQNLWKTLNIVVGVSTIINVTMVWTLFEAKPALASESAWLAPSTNANLNLTVTDPANAYTDNGANAVFNDTADHRYGGFGISLPVGSTVTGLEVQIEGCANTGNDKDFDIYLSDDNGASWGTNQNADNFDTNCDTETVGNSTNLWGRTDWTATDVSNANFAIRIHNQFSSGTIGVDFLAVRVTYTAPPVINSASVNGGATSTLGPDEAVDVDLNVTTVGSGSENDWRSTSYRLNSGSWVCVDTPNHDGAGTNSDSFTFNAPTDTGTYSIDLRAHNDNSCTTTNQSAIHSLANAIVVAGPNVTPNPALGQSCGLDIGLVVDRSGSMDSGEMSQLKTALKNFALAFDGTPTVFSLSSFSTDSTQNRAFSRTPQQMGAASGDIDDDMPSAGDGHTNWDSGLGRGFATFDLRPAKSNLLVIATDGSPNRFGYPTTDPSGLNYATAMAPAIARANTIKGAGTRIVVVGIGEDGSDPATPAQKLQKMKDISGATVATTPGAITTSTDVIKVTDFSGIGASLAAFANELCGGKILVQKQFDTNGDGQAEVTGNAADPLLSGWDFDVNGSPSNPALQTTTNTGSLEFTVQNGTYSIVEANLKPNTQFVSASCVKGQQPIGTLNAQTRTISGLTLSSDEAISCTYINGQAFGSLQVTKVVNGGSVLPHEFGFRFVGSDDAYVYPANGQNTVVFSNLQPGQYSIEETGPADYHQTNTTCSNVQVVTNQQATCTVTNERDTGRLIVNKNVDTDGDGVIDITGATDWTWDILNGDQNIATGQGRTLTTGLYTISEDQQAGYHVTDLTCNGVSLGPVESAQIPVIKAGRTCTFTNTRDTGGVTVIKHVLNDNGGNNTAGDFTMHIKQANSDMVTPFAGSEAGTSYTLPTGAYQVSESALPSGYSQTSIVCDGQATDSITVTMGRTNVCTITNDDIAPTITLNKVVTKNNGGNAGVNDFGLTIGGTPVNSGQTLAVGANTPYALDEAGLFGYAFVSLTGDPQCPQVLGGTATLDEGEHITCTITNDDVAPQLTVIKYVINDDGGAAVFSDFLLNVNGQNALPSQFNGSDTGTLVTLDAGVYEVTEDFFPGYTPIFSANCVGTLAVGESKTCVVTNTDDTPHLIVIKHVINDNGGNNDADGFTMQVSGTDVQPSTQFPGDELGTMLTLDAGQYNVTEIGLPGYTGSASADCQGTIALGQTKTCTITNDDIAPTVTLVKQVLNNDGGNADPNDFGLTIGGSPVNSGQTIVVAANTPIALNEASLPGYQFVTITGDAACPALLNGTVTLAEGDNVVCTIVNEDIAPSITLLKQVTNNDGGNAQPSDFALTLNGQAVTQGVPVAVLANTAHTIDEAALPGYAFASLSGDTKCPALLGGGATLDEGENITCTITNDDQPASLEVVKDGPATVQAGDLITYTIDWDVPVPGFAANAMLVDTLPADVTFISASNSGSYNSGTHAVTWNLGTLAAPASGSVTVTVDTLDPEYDGTVVHNEVVFSSDDDQDSDDHDTTIQSDFEVTLEKIGPATVQSGAQMTYTLDWTVSGNTPIDSLILTDVIPANTTFVSASNGGTESAGTVTWNLGPQAADANGSVTLTVQVANLLLDGTTIFNAGEVCAESDPQLHQIALSSESDCDDDSTTTGVNSDFSVTIVKTDSVDPVPAGGQLTYTLVWTVSGNAPVSNLVITDAVPANTSFVSASNGGVVNTGVVSWNLGAKVPGDTGSITMTVQVSSPIQNGTVLTNLANVCGQMFTFGEQIVEHCDDDPETTTVSSAPGLSITKSNNVAGFTNPGKTVTYTVVVNNSASATDTARNVVLTDLLPGGFTYATNGLGTQSFNLNDLAPGASVTTTYMVNISASQAAGIYTNTASAQGSNTSAVTATSNVDVRVPQILGAEPEPELTIRKTVKPTIATPGQVVVYTLTINNIGDADATNVVVTDTLPAIFTFIEGGQATKTWQLGTLKPNHERVINYEVRVGLSVKAGTYKNVAVVSADGIDPAQASANLQVRPSAILGLAATGVGLSEYALFVIGFALFGLGMLWLTRQRRHGTNNA